MHCAGKHQQKKTSRRQPNSPPKTATPMQICAAVSPTNAVLCACSPGAPSIKRWKGQRGNRWTIKYERNVLLVHPSSFILHPSITMANVTININGADFTAD